MPLEDGRFGACRVIQKDPMILGIERILVAATPWIGSSKPELSEPLLKKILLLNHHNWSNKPAILWISDTAPSDFKLIGSLKPSAAEEQIPCSSFHNWDFFPFSVLMQWRWDNDREAVMKEDEERQQKETNLREVEANKRREYLSKITLKELQNKKRFKNWEGYVTEIVLEAARNIFRGTIDAVIDLGPDASDESILDKLKWCIISLNNLDADHDGFIETEEREDLCAEFEEIVHASGLGHYKDLVDEWREW